MTGSPQTNDAATRPDADRDLVVLFARAIRLLGDAGYPVAANRLAAKAWWSLKNDDPTGAHRISGVMHHLAKLPDETVPIERRRTTVPATANTGVN
jgi:hypothetical protein